MREVVLVDGMRTAFGKRGGSLKTFNGTDLAVLVAKALLNKTQLLERGAKPDTIMCGSALIDSGSSSPARYVALGCDLEDTAGITVEMQCGSSIAAVNSAAARILAGCSDIALAGGFESHSRRVATFSSWVDPYKGLGPQSITRYLCPHPQQNVTMPEFSDLMAQRWEISREACDEFALRSQQRAASAVAKGYFKEEIVPVEVQGNKKTPGFIFDTDEHLRPQVTMEDLKKLAPVRGGDNVTTAGNASGLNDGASFILLMTAEKAKELGYEPFARWVTGADVGVEPRLMGIGPAYSNLLAIKRAGLTVDDIQPQYQNFDESADALKDGKIDAAFIVAGAPTPAITELAMTNANTRIVPIDGDIAKTLMKNNTSKQLNIIVNHVPLNFITTGYPMVVVECFLSFNFYEVEFSG
jgi:acetyl-CoA C-acetyltransferase